MDRPESAAAGESATEQAAPVSAMSLRQSNRLALVEFVIVALIFIADHRHLIPVSKTPFLLLLGWISLRIRKRSWRDVGLSRNRSWTLTLTLGVGGGLLLEVFQLFVTQPLLARLTGEQPDLSDFRLITGNVKYALIGVALAWTLAAMGEELVWRGYLMNRVAGLRRGTRVAWFCSLLAVNALFGLAHSNQGPTGIIEEGIAGVFLAGMYLQTGENLAVPILAHGTSDTLDVLLLFLGKYPGT
jgi:membrane protease YdiL (CAAX protease family)